MGRLLSALGMWLRLGKLRSKRAFLSATLGGLLRFCAGIRVLLACFRRRGLVYWPLCWHPRFVISLHASPLCGAAPTFLCRRKEK